MLNIEHANLLIRSLEAYYTENDNSYFPLDDATMLASVASVKNMIANRSMTTDARLNRMLGTDELEEPVTQLANLATALKDLDSNVQLALMYLNRDLI